MKTTTQAQASIQSIQSRIIHSYSRFMLRELKGVLITSDSIEVVSRIPFQESLKDLTKSKVWDKSPAESKNFILSLSDQITH